MEARVDEVQRINDKLDMLAKEVQAVYNILSEHKGANLPIRVTELEKKISVVELAQARGEKLEGLVDDMSNTIKGHSSLIYKVSGALILINIVFIALLDIIVDKYFR